MPAWIQRAANNIEKSNILSVLFLYSIKIYQNYILGDYLFIGDFPLFHFTTKIICIIFEKTTFSATLQLLVLQLVFVAPWPSSIIDNIFIYSTTTTGEGFNKAEPNSKKKNNLLIKLEKTNLTWNIDNNLIFTQKI